MRWILLNELLEAFICKKCDKTVKSMKSQKTPKERSSDSEESTCNSRDDMLNRRTDSKVQVHKFHEHDNDDEEGKNDKAKGKTKQ